MLGLVDLPLALVAFAFLLHVLGERDVARRLARPRPRRARLRAASFYAGLVVVIVALVGPLDRLAPQLFWVHMTQHVLLMDVAAPLIVLGAPWMSMWRPLPLGFRRGSARTVASSPSLAPLRATARTLARPIPAFIAFNVVLIGWHLPAAYDLTLRSQPVHDLEHITFLLFSVLLWAQVLHSPPLRRRLDSAHQIAYVLAASVPAWMLSLVLAFASSPLYAAYAHLGHRPGGISALADQQIAAGVMLGPGSLATTLFIFVGLYRWLGPEPTEQTPAPSRQYA